MTRRLFQLLVFSACCGPGLRPLPAHALEPIPADKRIEAEIVRTLAAPADQPMQMPTDVAVDRAGHIFVADGVNDRVVRFTDEGRLDLAITEVGGRRLKRPVGLTVDATDRLWIADTGNYRVVVVGPDGKTIETIDLPAPKGGRPVNATDVAVTPDGKLAYIVDSENHRVIVRDNQDRRLTSIGRFGPAIGQFEWPFMIFMGPGGYVYVSEVIGARVQRIAIPERWAGQEAPSDGFGVALGQLYRPKGVAVDARGRVYVTDSTVDVVQVFGPRGDMLGALVDRQALPVRFKHAMGMTFDAEGTLYVVELGANRVAVVSLRGKAAASSTSSTSSTPATGRSKGGRP
jgi:DNA-binding beta-propeller fold protein YncE